MSNDEFTHVERLWQKYKKHDFPLVSGEEERRLKIAFLQGMHVGQFFVTEVASCGSDKVAAEAITRVREQIDAEMERLGYHKKKPSSGPKVIAHIDGQRIKDN